MKKFLNYFLILTLVPVLVLSSCKKDEEDTPEEAKGTFVDLKDYMVVNDLDLPTLLDGWVIDPKMIADGGIVDVDYTIPGYHVFDIRGAADFNAGHIKGSINVALADVVSTAANYTDKPILVVCYTGQTAGRAVMALRLSGYSNAKVMKFGFSYWTADTYVVGGDTKSFDKWTSNVGDPAVGHQNWSTDASASLPVNNYPDWESNSTDGATILAERVTEMLAMDWSISSATILADAPSYNIYNFWSEADYLALGHFAGAYQIMPISIDGDVIKAFPTSDEFEVYCYTGQTSSYTTAWLQVLGYNAKSISFGVNGLQHTALDNAGKPAWHQAKGYEYEVTAK
ncbi:MAG: rhodanese-like domain-containing protein [Bacteroidales bacterium]|nr:rhodanese-like domain-containing protein [Bacteroidales bacterium]MCF8402660.1 rhodanese-like domain-containing protein [Bacteroidales bacterium]